MKNYINYTNFFINNVGLNTSICTLRVGPTNMYQYPEGVKYPCNYEHRWNIQILHLLWMVFHTSVMATVKGLQTTRKKSSKERYLKDRLTRDQTKFGRWYGKRVVKFLYINGQEDVNLIKKSIFTFLLWPIWITLLWKTIVCSLRWWKLTLLRGKLLTVPSQSRILLEVYCIVGNIHTGRILSLFHHHNINTFGTAKEINWLYSLQTV